MEHKPYIRPKDQFWYMRNSAYKKYMVREASSIFVGLWTLNLLFGILRLTQGEAAWNQWLAWQGHWFMVGFSCITLLMAMVHTVTWFAIAPRAMPKYIAGKKIEQQQVVWAHWAVFTLTSLGLIILTIWGDAL